MKAAQENTNPDVLRVLIENRANVNAIDRSDWTPLMNAARFNSNPSILRALVENGAKVNAVNMHNWTPLMLACINNSSPEVIRLLIENGANINAESENRETTLMIAAEGNSNPEVLRLLIENGADVNAENDNGETPLMKAAKGNPNPEVLRFLIENGVRVNIIGNDGKTPLIKAAEYNSSPRILRLLIENGADVSIKDKEGRRAFDYAEGNERLKSEYALYLRETMVESDVNLNLYHPWSESANIPDLDYPSFLRKKYNYPKLDTPATLLISGDYPKLDGATSSYPIYAAVTNEVFAISNKKELQRYLFCSKTENAYDRLVHGEVDIIFVLQPSDEQLQSAKDAGIELNFIPIAKDAFVFFVNKLNPVSNLTVEQIRNIYIKKITNWRIVGGKNREIVSYQRPANSGSQTAMIKEIMKGEKLPSPVRKRVHIANTMLQMVLEVAQDDEESIGYSFRFFTEEMMRDVWGARKNKVDYFQLLIDLISKNDTESRVKHEKYRNEIRNVMMNPVKLISVNGIAPSEENIRNGTYPFTVDVYAVTARTSNPHAQDLIDWMLSPQGQELIEKAGYVGVMTNRD
jgi:phosphate transport system substrate-binding protein